MIFTSQCLKSRFFFFFFVKKCHYWEFWNNSIDRNKLYSDCSLLADFEKHKNRMTTSNIDLWVSLVFVASFDNALPWNTQIEGAINATSTSNFTYMASLTPTITSVLPNSGGSGGGTRINITGQGFDSTSNAVSIGKSIFKFKISPLDGNQLKVSWSCTSPDLIPLRNVRRIRNVNKFWASCDTWWPFNALN